MEKKDYFKEFIFSGCLLLLFLLWTVLVKCINVQPIGPNGSEVGFAGINEAFHNLTGVHMWLYKLTDLLELIPLLSVTVSGFAGLVQLIKRKSLFKVDSDILVLGGFYVAVFIAFFLFELLKINCRPVLIENELETSYPSSTTMLVLCVMPATIMRLKKIFVDRKTFTTVKAVLIVYTVFMAVGRLFSGVHWFTDIIGGALLSAALVSAYISADKLFSNCKSRKKI